MRLLLFNARGYSGKGELINQRATDEGVDVIFVCETWRVAGSREVPGSVLDLRRQRVGDRGGRNGEAGLLVLMNPAKMLNFTILCTHSQQYYAVCKINNVIITFVYFPPRNTNLGNDFIDEIFDKTIHYASRENLRWIILGDLNARTHRSRDHHETSRGRYLNSKLDEFGAEIKISEQEDPYTSIQHNGNGIPDICIGTMEMEVRTTVLEDMMGSDHRPIIFDIPEIEINDVQFTRWNINKLKKQVNRDLFYNSIQLESHTEAMITRINMNTPVSQEEIDWIWGVIVEEILRVANLILGKVELKFRSIPGFWTQELLDEKRTSERLARQVRYPNRAVAFTRLTAHNQRFRKLLQKRRAELFRETMDGFIETKDHTGFMKLVNRINKATKSKKSGLDGAKVNEYAQHFHQIVGVQASGNPALIDEDLLQRTKESFKPNISIGSYEFTVSIIEKLPRRKACGSDTILGEMIQAGGDKLARAIHAASQISFQNAKIPSNWNTLHTVPIPKKGDLTQIKNNRPISLSQKLRRIYERIVRPHLKEAEGKLNTEQCGFREGRSSLHQVELLRNVMKKLRKRGKYIFFDIMTAYDTMNRNICYSELKKTFGLDEHLIAVLRSLFDNLVMHLIVNGSKSEPIPLLRGFPQGSSISPFLCNVIMNILSCRLKQLSAPVVDGVASNHFLFADDTNTYDTHSRGLLVKKEVCEEWARDVGVVLHPTKTKILSSTPLRITVSGVENENVEAAEGLGIWFSATGILWDKTIDERVEKALKAIRAMQHIGLNSRGWNFTQSLLIYKIFIRSMMEHGLQIDRVPNKQNRKLQKCQNEALRTMLSLARNTSVLAMHKVARIETTKQRNLEMWTRFQHKLNDGNDEINSVAMFHHQVANQNRIIPPAVTTPLEKTRARLASLNQIRFSNVGGAITLEEQDWKKYEWIFKPTPGIPKKEKEHLVRWRMGAIAIHQKCVKCGQEASRQHAIDCAQVEPVLRRHFRITQSFTYPENIIDHILNKYRYKFTPRDANVVIKCIKKIRIQVFGHNFEIEPETNQTLTRIRVQRVNPSGLRNSGVRAEISRAQQYRNRVAIRERRRMARRTRIQTSRNNETSGSGSEDHDRSRVLARQRERNYGRRGIG